MKPIEIILICLASLILVMVTILVIMTLKRKSQVVNIDLQGDLGELKDSMNKTIQQSILDFNDRVNQKLMENAKLSHENIASLQMGMYKELTAFQNKINEKMTEEFKVLNTSVDTRMMNINSKVEERLDKGFNKTNETFKNILERMTIIEQAQTHIEGLSNEMVSLQALLSNNQKRGAFGEFQLNQILFNTYGENKNCYDIQYTIKEGKDSNVRADAVIFMPPPYKMLCIDSKFPLTSYSKLVTDKVSAEEEKVLLSSMSAEVKKHIDDIIKAYLDRKDVDKFAHVATIDEIKENGYNLNIPRYVDTFEEEELIDIEEVQNNIARLKVEIAEAEAKMEQYLKELGLN